MARSQKSSKTAYLKPAFYLVCLGLLAVLVVREKQTFVDSLQIIRTVSPYWILTGFAMLLLSVLASSAVYRALSIRPLAYWQTVMVQTGSLGINRLLPAGSGALGVAYLFLRANRVGKVQAATIVTANNLLGFVGHALLLGGSIVLYPHVLDHFQDVNVHKLGIWIALAGFVVGAVILVVLLLRRRKLALFSSIRPLFQRPQRLSIALFFSILITLCYASAVLLSAAALGYHLSFAASLLVLSFSVAAASAIPIPGGVGAAEAGIFAGMHAYGASVPDALAIALLYRVMTFWLPLLVGGVVFIFVIRARLLSVKA